MATWTPTLSGSINDKGINTTNSSYQTLQFNITTGNPMIGSTLTSLQLDWQAQYPSPASGTWTLYHYNSSGTLQGSASTTATPPTSVGSQVFTADSSTAIADGDYFQLKCDETDNLNRNPQFPTKPTCTGNCQWSCARKTDDVSFNYCPSTWTYGDTPPPTTTTVLLPPPYSEIVM